MKYVNALRTGTVFSPYRYRLWKTVEDSGARFNAEFEKIFFKKYGPKNFWHNSY